MSEDALTFLGAKPSPALSKHLHQRRCEYPQSLVDLGKAAFAPEKTREEFGLYDAILERDPGFAEVRYWYANQKKWMDGDEKYYYRQTAQSLGSYVTASALGDFDPEDCPDKALAKDYPQWVQQAEELVGPDFPDLVKRKLIEFRGIEEAPSGFVENATRVAARWPNQYWLLHDLARVYLKGGGLPVDADMAAGIEVAALRDRFLPGIGHKNNSLYELAGAMLHLGNDDIVAQILTPLCSPDQLAKYPRERSADANVLGKALVSCGRYADAVPLFLAAYKGDINEVFRRQNLVHAGTAAALAGQADVLDGILRDHGPLLTEGGVRPVLEAYRDALAGKPVDGGPLLKQMHGAAWDAGMEAVILCAQLDLMAKKNDNRGALVQWLTYLPDDRRLWFLMDAYDRQEGRPESAAFYDMIEWHHGKDPWVVKAVAAWRERSQGRPAPKVMTADELGRKLKGFQAVRWPKADLSAANCAREILNGMPPGTVDGVIRRLLADASSTRPTNWPGGSIAWRSRAMASPRVSTPTTLSTWWSRRGRRRSRRLPPRIDMPLFSVSHRGQEPYV